MSASTSRTIVAEDSGARTQVTGVVGALAVGVILVVENDLGRYIPSSTLAAIIIAASFTLFDFASLRWLWKVRRSELWVSLVALLGVAVLGALEGILVAIALSLANFVRRAWRPYDAVLGRIDSTKGYHDVDRHPEARQIPGLVLYRFDAPLFFANAELFVERLLRAIRARGEATRWVIVAAEPITDIDTTGAEILGELLDALDAQGVTLAFAELKGPVKDRLRSYDLYDRIGDSHFFPTLGTAINGYSPRPELNGSTGARSNRTTPNHDGSRVARDLCQSARPPLPLMPRDRPIPDTATRYRMQGSVLRHWCDQG